MDPSIDRSSFAARVNLEESIRIAKQAALTAACMAAFLALCKLGLFFLTGSMIIALSAWDSFLDVSISLLNRKIIKFARQKADNDHPYGHGRAESIAALGQAMLILGGAISIVISSIKEASRYFSQNGQFDYHSELWHGLFFIFSACLSFALTSYLRKQAKKISSPALHADAEHYKMDYFVNISTALAIFSVFYFKLPVLDPILAILFASYMIFEAVKLLRKSVNELMDADIPDEIKKQVVAITTSVDDRIIDIHRFRGRRSGTFYFFDFHLTLPAEMTFKEVHAVVEKIEDAIKFQFDGDVVIHADPDHDYSSVSLSENTVFFKPTT